MSMDEATLANRLTQYFDSGLEFDKVAPFVGGLAKGAGGYEPVKARLKILAAEGFDVSQVQRYALYPLDNRWCYYSAVQGLWNRARPELIKRTPSGETLLVVRRFAERPKEGRPTTVTSALPDYHLLRPNVVAIPMTLGPPLAPTQRQPTQGTMFGHTETVAGPTANLSEKARRYLASLGLMNLDDNLDVARHIWFHLLAITYSPLYLDEHRQGIRADLPRVPLPISAALFKSSAELGRTAARLLDVEKPVPGVTGGRLRRELALLGRLTESGNGVSLNISCGWGSFQPKNGIVMPGKGDARIRSFSSEEKEALRDGSVELAIEHGCASSSLGNKTLDIYLNGSTYWGNVPEAVWDYTIGGYQVLKKWLSYREHSVLGRDITKDEAREFSNMVRRLAALIIMEPALDDNYKQVREAAIGWDAV